MHIPLLPSMGGHVSRSWGTCGKLRCWALQLGAAAGTAAHLIDHGAQAGVLIEDDLRRDTTHKRHHSTCPPAAVNLPTGALAASPLPSARAACVAQAGSMQSRTPGRWCACAAAAPRAGSGAQCAPPSQRRRAPPCLGAAGAAKKQGKPARKNISVGMPATLPPTANRPATETNKPAQRHPPAGQERTCSTAWAGQYE